MLSLKSHKPLAWYCLVLLLFIEGILALMGGFKLIKDPTGSLIGMPTTLLSHSPFSNFLIPGIVLFCLLGVFPLVVIYLLLFKPQGKFFSFLNLHSDRHYSWSFSLYVGLLIILWIFFEVWWVGYTHPLQIIFSFLGMLIIMLALMPSVKNHYLHKNNL